MKVTEISFENFKQYKSLKIRLSESQNSVFIGVNGSGKTTVLDGVALCLSHVVGKLTSHKDSYNVQYAPDSESIRNGKTRNSISIQLEDKKQTISIGVNKELDEKGFNYQFSSESTITSRKEKLLSDGVVELPLIVYYRTNRSFVIDDTKHASKYYHKNLNGYQYALTASVSPFSFFEKWILDQENIENEQKVALKNFDFNLESLSPVREAIEVFLSKLGESQFKNLRGKRKTDVNFDYGSDSTGELLIDKDGKTIKLNQLSSGERSLISLVLDIAVRLVLLNGAAPDSLKKNGVALIDEIEMHLHPKWQRGVIPALASVFPNVQFIITTHSPQILSMISQSEIILLDDKLAFSAATNPLGRDSNGILEEILGSSARPKQVDQLISEIFEMLNESQISEVDVKIDKLKSKIASSDPVLLQIESIRERIKLLSA